MDTITLFEVGMVAANVLCCMIGYFLAKYKFNVKDGTLYYCIDADGKEYTTMKFDDIHDMEELDSYNKVTLKVTKIPTDALPDDSHHKH